MPPSINYLVLVRDADRDHRNNSSPDSLLRAEAVALKIKCWIADRQTKGRWAMYAADRMVSREVAEQYRRICADSFCRGIVVTSDLPRRMDSECDDREYNFAVVKIYKYLKAQELCGAANYLLVLELEILNSLLSEFFLRQYEDRHPPPRKRLEPGEAYLIVVSTGELVEFHEK